ncbi:DUF7507 domain-containing protein [Flavobacterium gilvum]|uniref:DUF7507 domain-containing protein n=1 Tax=Flavobacterium gilvum TaxID=1492737 RepID=A0AAC9I6V6_9FLAO|nr:gliding motility-associated C-terminal domain-containing protein [Flavobacterium gilvum]AOW10815.1 hypothetical protein EM308_15690 [Flavobacterium gilvum]KFC59971.1 hypothetical protein FEM08_12750 [Flavobacterium gilvum]
MEKKYPNLPFNLTVFSIVSSQALFKRILLLMTFYLCSTTIISAQCNSDVPIPFIESTFGGLTATSSISGVCVCTALNEPRLIDANLNNFATAVVAVGAIGTENLRVTDTNTDYLAGTYAGFKINTGGLLNVNLLGSITITTYLNGVEKESVTGASLLGVGLLNGSSNDYVVGFNTKQSFDAIEISVGGLVSLLNTVNVYYPVIRNYCAGPALICNTATAMNLPVYPVSLEPSHTGVSGVSIGNIYDGENVISSNTNDFATISLTAGVLATGNISVKDQLTDYPVGTYAGFEIENTSLLNVSALGNVTVTTYLDGVAKQIISGNNLVATGTLLNSSGRYKVGFVSTTSFDEVQISINQTLGVNLGSTKVYGAVFENFCAGPDLVCNTQTGMVAPTYPVYINAANTGIEGVACLLCSVKNAENLIDQTPSNYAEINLTAGVLASGSISVKDQIKDYPIGSFVGFTVENPALLSVNALDAITITTYLDGVPQEIKAGNTALATVGTNLLVGTSPQTIGFIATKSFDEARITIANTASVNLGIVRVYQAVFEKLCPVTLECNKTYSLTNPTFPVIIDSNKTGVQGVACVSCAVNDTNNVLTASTTDFARIMVTAGVIAPASIAVLDQLSTYPAGTIAGFTIRDRNSLLQLDLFNSLTISTYLDGVLQESRSASNIINLNLLTSFGTGAGMYNVGFRATKSFDEIRITVGSLASVINDINVYGAFVNTSGTSGGTLFCAVIDAIDDNFPPIAGASGDSNIGNVLTNDTLSGNPATISDVNLAVLTPAVPLTVGASVPSIDIATGVVSVPAGTPAGNYSITYQICYKLNSLTCDTATVNIVVTAATINAEDDTNTTTIYGNVGGNPGINVYANDTTVGGVLINPSDVTLSSTPNGPLTVNADGSVTVAPNTPAGTYTVTYTICENLNGSNCDSATVTVLVSAVPIDAVNDNNNTAPIIYGNVGGNAGINVYANDTLNGVLVNPSDVIFGSSPNGPLTVNADGSVTVAPNTPAGTYTVDYTICEKLNSANNCDTATVTVVVSAAVVDAVVDTNTLPVYGNVGGNTDINVYANDTLNGVLINPSDFTLISTPTSILTINPDGSVTVAPKTPAGTYSVDYTICEKLNSTNNCDTATVTVVVSKAVVDAVVDTNTLPVYGNVGGNTDINVLANDTQNGVPVNRLDVTLTSTPTSILTINPDGSVTVAPNTPAGSYTIDYTICEKLNLTTNCDTATVTVVVSAAVVDAVVDTNTLPVYGNVGGNTDINVYANDTLNGVLINPSDFTLTSTPTSQLKVNTDGSVTVAPNTPVGTYSVDYTICEKLNLTTNCDTATVTVVVSAAVVDAVVDTNTLPVYGNVGGNTGINVLANDTQNGVPVNPLDVTLISTPTSILTINPDGSVTVASNTPVGTYSVDYTICEKLNSTTNCDTATVTVVVSAAVVDAVVDTNTLPVYGNVGGNTGINVLANDTQNGVPVNPLDVTLTSTPNGPLTINPDGSVTVAPNTPAGTYSVDYTICEKLNSTTNCDTATVTVAVSFPSIAVVKTSVVGGTGKVGDLVTYTFTVTNTGDTTLNGIVINDALTNSVNLSVTPSTLVPNGIGTATSTYIIKQSDIDAGKITNSATVTGTIPTGGTVTDISGTTITDNTPTVTTLTTSPSIAVVKTSVVGGTGKVGDVVTYTFTVTNTGNTTLSNIVINDVLTNTVNKVVTVGNLAPNATATTTVTYIIKQSDIDAGKITNSATVTGTTPAGGTVTDISGTAITNDTPTVTTLTTSPSIAVVKTSVVGTTIKVGDKVTYTFTVTNTGNTTLNNIVINDALTNTVNLAVTPSTLAPNSIGTATSTYIIKQSDIDAGQITNSATVIGTIPTGGTVTDISGTAVNNDNPTITTLNTNSAISIMKEGTYEDKNKDGIANVGDVINYSFTVTNTGNVSLHNITIQDNNVTTVKGTLSSLSVGASDSVAFSAVYSITDADIVSGYVYNSAIISALSSANAKVTAVSTDPTPCIQCPVLSNCLTCTITAIPQAPSIAIIKKGVFRDENGDGYAEIGETIDYSFTIMNTGNLPLTNVTLTDALVGIVISGGPINLAVGATDTTTFKATYHVTQQDVVKGSVTNQAIIKGFTPTGAQVTDLSDDDSPLQDDPTVLEIDGCTLEVFNAVSPDGDGLNDIFRIRGIECYPKNSVQVFNRWGVKVYEAEGYNNDTVAFKGYSEGRVTVNKSEGLPTGTYFYVIKYEDFSGAGIDKSGYLNISRN